MMIRFAAAAALGLALLAPAGAAQTAAEQLQKGIYLQETAGDLDGAIEIYRQVVRTWPAERTLAATAQYRLAQAFLQKGDLDAAAREFQSLALHYPEHKELIAALAGRFRNSSRGATISLGTYTVNNNVPQSYQHRATGVELRALQGWTMRGDTESSDDGQMVVLSDEKAKALVSVWMKAENYPVSEIPARLQNHLDVKPSQRSDFNQWKIRPESIQRGGAGDHQWLRAIADFKWNGQPMVEYLTWVQTAKTHVVFFARFPASGESQGFPEKFAALVGAAVVP
jgi:tetratricopeptide (TPR) repeat protein